MPSPEFHQQRRSSFRAFGVGSHYNKSIKAPNSLSMNNPSSPRLHESGRSGISHSVRAIPNLRFRSPRRRAGTEEAVVLKMGDLDRRPSLRWCASTRSASPATSSTACAAIAARSSKSPSTSIAARRPRPADLRTSRKAAASACSTNCAPTSCRITAPTPSKPTNSSASKATCATTNCPAPSSSSSASTPSA